MVSYEDRRMQLKRVAQTLALSVLGVCVYWPTVSFDFTLDDSAVTTLNADVAADRVNYRQFFTTTLYHGTPYESGNRDLYRPLTKVSMALNAGAAGGFDPYWFHFVNVILYGLVIAAVLAFFRVAFQQAGQPERVALFAAALFVVFPSHLESVANVKHREELLACAFGLFSWLAVLKTDRSAHRSLWTAVAALSFLAALLSKESSALLAPCMLIWEWFHGRLRKAFTWSAALLGAFALYAALRLLALGSFFPPSDNQTFFSSTEGYLYRLGVSCWIFLRYYIFDQLVSLRLDPAFSSRILLLRDHSTTLLVLVAGAVAAAVGLACWAAVRRRDVLGTWLLFFFISSFLTFNVIRIGTAGAFRFMFTPSIFLCAAVALLFDRAAARVTHLLGRLGTARVSLALSIPLLVWFGLSTRGLMGTWQSDGALFGYSARVAPQNPLAHYALGQWQDRRGDKPSALSSYGRALQIFSAVEASPAGQKLFDERSRDAFSVVATEIAFASVGRDPLRALGLAEVALGQFDRLREIRRGRQDTNVAAPYYVKALAQVRLRRFPEAIVTCRAGLAVTEHRGLRQTLQTLLQSPGSPGQ